MTKTEFFTKALPKLLWLNNNFSLENEEYKQNQQEFFNAEIWFAKHFGKDTKELIAWIDQLYQGGQIDNWCWMLFTSYIESKTCPMCYSTRLIWNQRKATYTCQECGCSRE